MKIEWKISTGNSPDILEFSTWTWTSTSQVVLRRFKQMQSKSSRRQVNCVVVDKKTERDMFYIKSKPKS